MILLKYKELFIKFIFCSILLVIVMLVLSKVFYKKPKTDIITNNITSKIHYDDEITRIDVEYPRFNNDKINKIITDNLYAYIKDFKAHDGEKTLKIKYKLIEINNFVNVQYSINNTLSDIKHENILLDTKKGEIAYINSLYDEEYLKNEIYKQVNDKYPKEVYEQVVNDTINNFTYILNDDNLTVYFNNIESCPCIKIDYSLNTHNNDNQIHKHKYLIFMYNDGPSEYTNELLEVLDKYDSRATFFMTGNKMKYYDKVVLDVFNSRSEIGSHGFSHINLVNADINTIKSEINSTNAVFNELTHSTLKLYTPAYGGYNEKMDKLGLKIVNYDIDTKDWLVKDSKIIYNNVIKNACDGCAVLMHDTYKQTIEATDKLIPELNKLGYEVISVSEYDRIIKE